MSFYLYITTLMAYFIYLDIMCYLNIDAKISEEIGETQTQIDKSLIFGVEDIDRANYWLSFVIYEILIIVNLFLCPLSYLVYVQTVNVLMDTTTNMRFNKFKRVKNNEQSATNEFIEGLRVEQDQESIDFREYNSY